jgi:hypothetical protein
MTSRPSSSITPTWCSLSNEEDELDLGEAAVAGFAVCSIWGV